MSGFAITVRENPNNRRVYRWAEELEDRVRSIVTHMPIDMAHEYLTYLTALAPRDMGNYPDLLMVRRFKVKGIESVAGVVAPGAAHIQRLNRADVARTVLYVNPRIVGGKAVDPASVVLWEHNPWTMMTLPFEPSRMGASIVSRRVSNREVAEIERLRMSERPSVDQQLRGLGVVPVRIDPALLDRPVIRDLAFEILRREYGLGDAPHVAHWRPVSRLARGPLVKRVLKSYLRWLAVPSEQRWKRRPRDRFGNPNEVKRVQGFQKYVRA